MAARRSRRSRLENAGWSALLTVSLIGCVELFFRVFLPPPDLAGIQLDYDADLMWDLAERAGPGIEVNALGLRGPELGPKEAGRPRLLTLGDSSVFGDRVRYEQVFSTVAAATLARAGTPIEPVIGAIPGYSSFQARRWYARIAPEVRPDLVVIGALWSDAIRREATDAQDQERLQAIYGPWRRTHELLRWPAAHSAVFAWVQAELHAVLERQEAESLLKPARPNRVGWITDAKPEGPGAPPPAEPGAPPPPGAPPGEGGLGPPEGERPGVPPLGSRADPDGALPTPHVDPAANGTGDQELHGADAEPGVARVPLEDYRANLTAMIEAARAEGARPLLLLLPHPRDDAGEELPSRYAAYRAVMREVAAASGVALIDGERWFEEHPCGCARFADEIHPNAAGHATLAEALVDTLRASGGIGD